MNICIGVEVVVSVVVPAAVAVEVEPSKRLFVEKFLFASHSAIVEAVGVEVALLVIVSVPLVVIGLPVTLMPFVQVAATLETVPA